MAVDTLLESFDLTSRLAAIGAAQDDRVKVIFFLEEQCTMGICYLSPMIWWTSGRFCSDAAASIV
jgi:hypothetical protein